MMKEEIEEIMRLANAGRPQVNQTFNFNAPIGQQIAHVDKIEAHFDKDMGMQIAMAEDAPSTPIKLNSIFKQKVFNTNAKEVRLRDAVGARIKGAKLTDGSGLLEDRPQIDPSMQNEWYYVWKMIAESELLDRKVTVRAFIAQMLEWFPEVFEPVADEEQKKSFIEKMGKSISREKSKWVQDRQEVPFKDMMSKWPELQLYHNKVRQMFLMCRDLRDALQNLKSAIEKEEAAEVILQQPTTDMLTA